MKNLNLCVCGGEAKACEVNVCLETAIIIKCIKCGSYSMPVLIDHPLQNAEIGGVDERTRYNKKQAIHKAAENWNRRNRAIC